MLGDLFYRLGSAMGAIEGQIQGLGESRAGGSGRPVAIYDPEDGEVHDIDGDAMEETMEGAALAAAGAWLLSRILRPRPVSWPRVVMAGVAATLLADLAGRMEDDDGRGSPPYAADPEELLSRFGAGVAVAAGYAALLYPRIPGSPLFRGLAFGALEIAAAPRGGLAGLAAQTPGVKFPLQALAMPVDEDAGPLSHLAYGLGLGLFYRFHDDDRDELDELEDE